MSHATVSNDSILLAVISSTVLKESDLHQPASNDPKPRPLLVHAELALLTAGIIGALLGYAVTVVAARNLGPEFFNRFILTITLLGVASNLTEAGVGKYGLKILPAYKAEEAWGFYAGYWRFGIAVCAIASLSISNLLVMNVYLRSHQSIASDTVFIGELFLPIIALSGVLSEYLMAAGRAVIATVTIRVIAPLTTLIGLEALPLLFDQPTAPQAISCYVIGSAIASMICLTLFLKRVPKQAKAAKPIYRGKRWLFSCVSFATFGFLMAWLLQMNLVIAGIIDVPEDQLAHLAAAMQSGCLVMLIAKSTDKYFQPQLSKLITKKQWQESIGLRNQRHQFVALGNLVFLGIIVMFGRDILSIYGPKYVDAYSTLCWIAVGACFWTQFSMAPAFLNFIGLTRWVNTIIAMTAVAMTGLTIWLCPTMGIRGAGIAFTVTVAPLAVGFALWANLLVYRNSERLARLDYLDN